MTTRYILIDAPGYYGTYATVRASYPTLDQAISAAARMGNVVVCDDGGNNANHAPGCLIHGQFASRYEVLWSLAGARRQKREAAAQKAYLAAHTHYAELYGRGSHQYFAALDNYATTGNL